MKVMTVLGTRPEIIKLSRVVPELDKHFEHILIHTGQNYDKQLKDVFFEEMGIRKPDVQLNTRAVYAGPMLTLSNMLSYVDLTLRDYKPDAVLILGDTNSAVAAAYAAKRRHIPLFHMEAGNRCFDDRTPEEINRRIIDHISDINMPYTEHARGNLLAEGIKPDRIIKTGSPMREVLDYYIPDMPNCTLPSEPYYLVSCHREENVDDQHRLQELVLLVNALPGRVIFSVHPRTRARLDAARFVFTSNVTLHEPFSFFGYTRLQQKAKCVISDSGTLTEEAALLDFPAVMIRQSHERPEGMDAGTAIMADFDQALAAVKMAEEQGPPTMCPDDYFDDDVSKKVARTIQSYTSYIQRNVWHKS